MKTTVIYCHPWNKSFNSSILNTIVSRLENKKTDYNMIDLYKDKFDPVLNEEDLSNYTTGKTTDPLVLEYQKKLMESDQLIFVFPIWWAQMPALLKGFLDKVLLKHFSWDIGKFGIDGKLNHIKQSIIITTMDTPNWYYKWLMQMPLKKAFNNATLKAVGIKKVKWFSFGSTSSSTINSRSKFIKKISNQI